MSPPPGGGEQSQRPSDGGLPAQLADTLASLQQTDPIDPRDTIRSAVPPESELPPTSQRPTAAHVAQLPRLDVGAGEDVELRVVKLIGRGGMAHVQLAEQRSLSREVALKGLKPGRAAADSVSALLHEGIVTGRLEHPNIIPVHMVGLVDGKRPAIVMKRVEGVPWGELIQRDDHPAWHKTKVWSTEPLMRHLEILLDVCSAIEFAHSRGWVHRDIKPTNVMIGSFGEVYLLDWGVATEVGTPAHEPGAAPGAGVPLGTPAYMSPEMLSSHGCIDERTDIYQLGGVLHEVLTKQPPHPGVDLFPVLQSVARSKPYDYAPSVPRELAAVCHRAMAASPAERYASAERLREALSEYMRHRSSLQLAEQAAERLETLEERIAQLGDAPDDEALADVRKLYVETSFAFRQSLRQWPGNVRASKLLQRCIEVMIDYELSRGSADAAYALIAELPQRNPALAAIVKRARDEQQLSRARIESLQKLERDLDVSVSRRQRLAMFLGAAGMGLASVMLMVSFGGREPIVPVTAAGGLVLMLIVAVGLALMVAVWRKWLLRNAANRRIVMLLALCVAGMTGNRALCVIHEPPNVHLVAIDLLVCALVIGVGAATIDRRLALPSGLFAAGSLTAVFLPQDVVLIFIIFTVAALVAGGLILTTGAPSSQERTAALDDDDASSSPDTDRTERYKRAAQR